MNFLQTISDYIEAEVSLKNLLNNHLKERVNLARYSGIDDLPDLLFEHMTKKEVTQTEYESFRNNNRTNGKTQKRTTKLQQSKNKGNQKEIIVDKIQRNSPEDLDDLDDLDDLEALEDLEIQE
mgnify:FL=1